MFSCQKEGSDYKVYRGDKLIAAFCGGSELENAEAESRALRFIEDETSILDMVSKPSAEGFIVVDKSGNFVLWNEVATKLIGSNSLNNTLDKIYDCYQDEACAHKSELLNSIDEPIRDELIYVKNDGVGTWLNICCTPMVNGGAIMAFRDVTNIKKLKDL